MFHFFDQLNLAQLPTPCYVIDAAMLSRNLRLLRLIKTRSKIKILLALKGFATHHYAPLISQYLDGVCASGLHEAKLGREFFSGEVHTYATAYCKSEIKEILALSDHVIFNSFNQWQRHQAAVKREFARRSDLKFGLRINPKHSVGKVALYDPSADGSRLGIVRKNFKNQSLTGITGLHVHNLCEQNVAPLRSTLQAVEEQFADFLPQMQWLNIGGGHLFTHRNYQRDEFVELINSFRNKWKLQIIAEPGEAVALGSGVYVCEVLDVIHNNIDIAIVNGSCCAHLPDVLEMPYRPEIYGAAPANKKAHTYRLGGMSCLAGDIFGDYSFDAPLKIGDRLMFMDMAHYTMVKNNTFNGVRLPSIVAWDSRNDSLEIVKHFDYEDFKMRLS